uniref:Uncharacterized protein n=1 Tax=Helianthus annuus TaxID=4232 RepID=A0A251VIG3_HELAN
MRSRVSTCDSRSGYRSFLSQTRSRVSTYASRSGFHSSFDTFQIEIPFSIFVLSPPQRSGFGSVDPKGKIIRDVLLPQKSLCTFIYIHLVRTKPCKTQNFIQLMFVSALNLQI